MTLEFGKIILIQIIRIINMKQLIIAAHIFTCNLAFGQEKNNDPEHLITQFAFMSQKEFKSRYVPVDRPYEKSTYVIEGFLTRNPTTKSRAEELSWWIGDYFNEPDEAKKFQDRVLNIFVQCPKAVLGEIVSELKPKLAVAALSWIKDPEVLCDIMYYVDEKMYDKLGPKLPNNDKASSDY